MPRRRATPLEDEPHGKLELPAIFRNPQHGWRFWQDYYWEKKGEQPPTRMIREIGEFMMNGPDRICILATRGSAKTMNAKATICRAWLDDPETRVLYLTGKHEHSKRFAQAVYADLMSVPLLAPLRPTSMQRKSSMSFDIAGSTPTHQPSFMALSIESQTQGLHADLIIVDDGETAENSRTAHLRGLNESRFGDLENLASTSRRTRIIVVGTPQCEETMYRVLLNMGYEVRAWPIAYPTREQMPRLRMWLAPQLMEDLDKNPNLHDSHFEKCGQPTDPDLFPEEKVANKIQRTLKNNFTQQCMMIPSIADEEALPLKLSDLMAMDLNVDQGPQRLVWSSDPATWYDANELPSIGLGGDRFRRPKEISAYAPYKGCVLALDPAGEGRDEFAWAVVSHLNGYFFLHDSGGMHGYRDENLEYLARLCLQYRVKTIYAEKEAGWALFKPVFEPFLRRITHDVQECVKYNVACPWYVGWDPNGYTKRIAKYDAIDNILQPLFQQHRIVVSKELVQKDASFMRARSDELESRAYRLFYQVTRFAPSIAGSLDKDDRLEAFAMGCHHFGQLAAIDATRAMARDAETEQMKQLNEAMKLHAVIPMGGINHKRPTSHNILSNNRIARFIDR